MLGASQRARRDAEQQRHWELRRAVADGTAPARGPERLPPPQRHPWDCPKEGAWPPPDPPVLGDRPDGDLTLHLLQGRPRKSAAEPPRSSTLCHLHRCGWDRAVLHIPKATKSHPCPCCFAGSFCDASDVLGADLLDCSYSIPDLQLVRRVVSQVEFYLSDENLAKDAFLLKHVQKNKMAFVSIKLLTSLKKVGSPLHWPAGVGSGLHVEGAWVSGCALAVCGEILDA
ncbi:uncharacterized protein ACIBXB_016036 [Morphnus guianensis]